MRNMKKLVAALLVLTMVAALAGTAFAYKEIAVFKPIVFKGTAWGYAKVTNNRGVDRSGVALKKGSYGYVVAEKGDWYKIVISGRGSSADEYLWFNKKYTRDFDSSKDSFSYLFSSGGSDRSGVLGIYSATKVAGKYTRVVVKDGRRTNVRNSCMPLAPTILLTADDNLNPCRCRNFSSRFTCVARSRIVLRFMRDNSRMPRTSRSGIKLLFSSPCCSNCAIHSASLTSVFRPGKFRICRAFTTSSCSRSGQTSSILS